MIEPALLEAAVELYTLYADHLDNFEWPEWLDLFDANASYRVTTRDNESRGLPAGIMLCANRAMLEDRVNAARFANVYRQHYNRHILSQPRIWLREDGDIGASCSFAVMQTDQDGAAFIFAVGKYQDALAWQDERLIFKAKAVILDNSRVTTSMPIPL